MLVAGLELWMLIFLTIVSFGSGIIGGFGGPAGIPILLTMFVFTSLPTEKIAGTAISVFATSAIFGTWLYHRSNDVNWRIVLVLVPTTLVGTQIGVFLNMYISRKLFGIILGVGVFLIGINIIYREVRDLQPLYMISTYTRHDILIFVVLGMVVGVLGGLLGIAGPVLTVPALVILGIPTLKSIGTGFAQAVFVTVTTSGSYLLHDAVVFPLVPFLGIPFILGIVSGWHMVHRINTKRVKISIAVMLLIFSPVLIRMQ
jgi:uncharacterized membrane protein YfcA